MCTGTFGYMMDWLLSVSGLRRTCLGNVQSRLEPSWKRLNTVLEPSRRVLSRLGDVLETSWSLQNQPKIGFGAISYEKDGWFNVWSPSDQWLESKSSRFGVSKAVKMEPNLSQNWHKNMTSNKNSFINPHRQVFETKLRPKSSTFLVNDIATHNIM